MIPASESVAVRCKAHRARGLRRLRGCRACDGLMLRSAGLKARMQAGRPRFQGQLATGWAILIRESEGVRSLSGDWGS